MKNLKLIYLVLICTTAFGQNGRFTQKIQQVKSLKVAFLTSELSLTPAEAAKFWPLYNDYQEKQSALRKQKIGDYLDRHKSLEGISDTEAATMLAQMENNEDQLYQLRKKSIASLRDVLPATKIIKLKKAEEDFNKKLLEQYRNRRGK